MSKYNLSENSNINHQKANEIQTQKHEVEGV